MSTLDNASAQLAIALQLHDLDELEASGTVDEHVIRLQRQQLEIDSGFDAVTFEASRRLAISMAKAVKEDGAILARSMCGSRIDDETFERLALLNHLPPVMAEGVERESEHQSSNAAPSFGRISNKRARSTSPGEPQDAESHLDKKAKVDQITGGHVGVSQDHESPVPSTQLPQTYSADVIVVKETASATDNENWSNTAECASCCEKSGIDELVKASCEHYYCKECFGAFVEASLQTHDGFPPVCCKIPLTFLTVADNVSPAVFGRYRARQDEIKSATALYCAVKKCGVKVETDSIEGVRATCAACGRDTCTRCRSVFPLEAEGKKRKHVCKMDRERRQLLDMAKEAGWQTCYQCGNLIALNFGCHHMTCRCKAEFCYRCGTKWRHCLCGDYDEVRIEIRAVTGLAIRERRRIKQGLPPDLRPREEQLAELQRKLRVDCDHNNFVYEIKTRQDPGYCRICDYSGWKYILRCENCRFTACRDCHNFFGWEGGEDPWDAHYSTETDDDGYSDSGVVSGDESI